MQLNSLKGYMFDMNSDHVLEVPDTPDQIKQSTYSVSRSTAMRDVEPSPRRKFQSKTRNNSMHNTSTQDDASSLLPAHADAVNIFRQADVARALAFPGDSEAKLSSQQSNKSTGTSLLNEKSAKKHVLDQNCSISSHISSNDAVERRIRCQIRDGEVSQQDVNHRNANIFGVRTGLSTIPAGKPRSRTGVSFSNRLKAIACPDVSSRTNSEEVRDEVITNTIISGPSNPPVVTQRHVGQKRLVRNGCISPSNIAKRSIAVDERQEIHSLSGVLHPRQQLDVYGTANVIDLTDNSPTIPRHESAVNISANIRDTREAKRLRTDRDGKALVPPSEHLSNGSNSYAFSLSGHNNKGKEINCDMLDSKRIGDTNSRRAYLSSKGTSVVNSSSSCVDPEQGWRTTHNHTSKLPISSMGSGQESGSSALFDLDHGSAAPFDQGNSSTSGATTIHTERLGNRTIRISGGRRMHALNSSHPGESSSAPDKTRVSFQASSETTVGRYHTARRHNISVINIEDLNPEVGPSSSGCDNDTSVDLIVQAQLESDELLARQLQEQLYNETPRVVPTENIDAAIAMSLQHEENAGHAYRMPRAVTRTRHNTRGAQGSHSNVYLTGVARTNNRISRRQNPLAITLGLDAVFPRSSGASLAQPNIDLNDYDALLALDENNHQHTGASESQINSLPQSVVQSNNIEESCAVCLENPSVGDTIRHLPCFHRFHKECIDEWLKRKKMCPICKSGIR